ncbi:hypothetical protein FSP39_005342 [Pinctada imbricata]|uniref:Tyr recombinase domain-containing protein n=1 Tax=Pinctada imbricata TaxID=66713 RepID=A0AA89BNP2_PINIB|nr:hypothetical protein FSP39_005342 [Pinctada imbricata]
MAVRLLLEDFDEGDLNDSAAGADTLMEISASTSNDEALREIAKALAEENQPSISTSTKSKPKRFKSLTEVDLKEIEDNRHAKSTKRKTKWGVNLLQEWSREKFGQEIDLHTISPENLNNNLRHFYAEIQPKPSEKENQEETSSEYHKNTIKGIRSALNRHLNDIGRNIDIVKDKEFKQANAALQGKLKQNMQLGLSKPTQHKAVISPADLQKISTYLTSGVNPVLLRYRVWFDLSIHFVSRGLEFHQQLNPQSFLFLEDDNGNEYVALSHETKQKNWQGGLSNQEAPQDKRMYATGEPTCPVLSLKSFLRHTDTQADALFNHIVKDASVSPQLHDTWYMAKPVKPYQFTKFMPDISRNAGCTRNYTAHCLRATTIQALNDDGFEIRHIMFMSGHRNEASVRSYNRECSTEQKHSLSKALARVSRPEANHSVPQRRTTNLSGPTSTAPAPPTSAMETSDGNTFNINNNTLNRNSSNSLYASFINNSSFNNCTFNFASNSQ